MVTHAPSTALKSVARPAKSMTNGRPTTYPYQAVLETLATDRAVLYPCKPQHRARIIEAMRRKLRRDGYHLGRDVHPEGLLLWAEKR